MVLPLGTARTRYNAFFFVWAKEIAEGLGGLRTIPRSVIEVILQRHGERFAIASRMPHRVTKNSRSLSPESAQSTLIGDFGGFPPERADPSEEAASFGTE